METVDISTLKVGDIVYYAKYPEYGWNREFRYPRLIKSTVTRITPKRTKVVLDDTIEVLKDNFRHLVIPTEEDFKKSRVAVAFLRVKDIQFILRRMRERGRFDIGSTLTDEELLEIETVMLKLYNKYAKEVRDEL